MNLKELEKKARLACSWLGSCSTWSALSKSTAVRLCQMSVRTSSQLVICMVTSWCGLQKQYKLYLYCMILHEHGI